MTEWTSSEIDSLREATAAWTEQVCAALAPARPSRLKTVITEMTGSGYSTRTEPELDLVGIAIGSRQLGDRAPALEAIRDAAAAHQSSFVDVPGYGQGFVQRDELAAAQWVSRRLAEPILVAYLRRTASLSFDRARFDEVFQLVEGELRSPSTPFIAYAPMARLRVGGSAPIEVLPGVQLRRATDADRERWLNDTHAARIEHVGLPDIQTVLEVRYADPNGPRKPEPSMVVQAQIRRLCSALQLELDCDASPVYVQFRRDTVLSGGPFTGGMISSDRRIGYRAGELLTSDVARVRELYRALETSPNLRHCRIALRRWEAVCASPGHEDTIVDSWVGLESMLFTGGASGELSYRASLRLSVLIGRDSDERRRLFSEIRKSYDARSRVLHGAETDAMDLPRLATESRGYLRRALIAVLGLTTVFAPNSIEADLLGQ